MYNRGFTIIKIQENGKECGAIEITKMDKDIFIENIFLQVENRNRGYLRQIINHLSAYGRLRCLPLPEHRCKFEHLGFKPYKQEGEDIYYMK